MWAQEGEASSPSRTLKILASGTLKILVSGTLTTLVAQVTTGSSAAEARSQEVQPRQIVCGPQEIQPHQASHGAWSLPVMTQGPLVDKWLVNALGFHAGQLTQWTAV